MKLTLKNEYLLPSMNLLQSLKLKGVDSIARSKFVKLLTKAGESLSDSEMDLVNEYGEPEDLTKPISKENPVHVNADGQYAIRASKRGEYQRERVRLLLQDTEIEGGTYVNHTEDLLKILKNYDEELTGEAATAYLELIEALERAEK
ncbi:hypothetical protein [Levilactobacillus humaensis]|uniref:hypothetical protein n=1 Tax=Levilactobacillus humaensis TaxID=2950375 RepID=UPI0021C45BFA|nr:hypothetical protein [Levilactobacillus humaensis]